ncbi:serine hydrolase domain-containing protein [Chitinophaga nivalis]|uniref:Beta-lactamase family protein n=1 Tax=Chitinophaga nivalis TaxID=2991709 RepID=A0ABT3IG74_9BACT|nr:serine hydrolase domain-containing protein [Chitinophaga nivalis]MCW3467345.1 beta-lactamase family protein [Chitinophaga nivalis]MCW3482963.1 beta-lactamase family protein [Chitinophaga nivalis]
MDTTTWQYLLDKTVRHKRTSGMVVSIAANGRQWTGAAGNLRPESPYFIASVTKLYITALIMQLRAAGKLQLHDRIAAYLPDAVINGLHIYRQQNYSQDITIRQLLSHTSGLPDYFAQTTGSHHPLLQDLLSGKDQAWTFDMAIDAAKKMKPVFAPGHPRKASYADTNFQLLGHIITRITGLPLAHALDKMISTPLRLENTYLYTNPADTRPAFIFYRQKPLAIPMAMASFGADGGIVSTAQEQMIFLQAFFNGQLFPQTYLPDMQQWRMIHFPLAYGTGIARFKLPAIFTLFRPSPALIGHAGLSGAFAFYCPEKQAFLTGTVNEAGATALPFRLMLQLLQKI